MTRPRAEATRLAVSNVPNLVVMIGSRRRSPDTSDAIDGCNSQTAVEDEAGQRRKALRGMRTHNCQHDVGSVARRDDGNAFLQPLQHVLGGHAGHQHMHRLA